MRVFEPKSYKEVNDLISYLASCHDGSIRKICFLKDRSLIENGGLSYPYDINDPSNCICSIEMELLLNCYAGAKKQQIVRLKFQKTKSFTFKQNENFDYSDIYELTCEKTESLALNFIFYASKDEIKPLSILCEKIICEEL